jgi:nicotinamidase-related amidase
LSPVTIDSKKTAILMMDFNRNSCTADRRPRCARVLPKLQKLLTEGRAHGLPVVHTLTNERATIADITPELAPMPGELVLTPGLDKFVTGEIAKYLKEKGVTTVILTGTSANGAVLFTVGGAVVAGFKAIVPVDGMPAETAYQEQFSVWNIAYGPRLREGATLTKIDMIKF